MKVTLSIEEMGRAVVDYAQRHGHRFGNRVDVHWQISVRQEQATCPTCIATLESVTIQDTAKGG